ncbi:MAG: hypothetical protein QOI51_2418 [Nocardioidaceae bacterium]|nr:hypothetical protein [Nocardioidaceae bacterium]MDX6308031.1 hypothetical protein [Nocardioidaceae bacterium]
MSRLVVHVGPPKTATTYFQRGLFANAAVLARHGVYLPRTGRLEFEPNAISHHHLAWDLVDSPRFRPDIGGWDALAVELAEVGPETVLISSEVLRRVIIEDGVSERLTERLLSFGRDVTILYVVRDQLSQINSAYAQVVKMLLEVIDFDPLVVRLLELGEQDLEHQLGMWYRSADVDFVGVPWPDLSRPNPLVALLRAARIAVPEDELVIGPQIVNITLGPVAVEAFRLLRAYLARLDPTLTDEDPVIRRLHRVAARRANELGWCAESYWGWTPELAARAAERLGPSNERFAQAVWGTPWPLPLPVERPPARVQLLSLPSSELDRVHQFVTGMARRYATLRSGADRATPQGQTAHNRLEE